MAIQILPQTSLGQTLGTALGTGLSSGLQGLLQNKLIEMERQKGIRQTQGGLQALGLPAEIAQLPEGLQQLVTKQIQQQPSRQSNANALNILFGGSETTNPGAETGNPFGNISELNDQQFNNLARLGLQKQKAETQQKQFQTKEARIEQHHIDKETKPYYDETLKAYKGAKNTNPILERMQTLLNNGNLPTATFYNLVNKWGGHLGLNVSSLIGADAQEFDKLTVEFLKNAKDIFGSRLTNYDVQTFLKGIPSLSQTDEGKQRIINNLGTVNAGALLRQKAQSDIIAENGGKRPANLVELIENRIEPQLDQLAEMFSQGKAVGKSARKYEQNGLNANSTLQLAQNQPQGPQNQQNEIPLTGTQLSRGKEPSTLQEVGRHAGRSAARAAETVANIPGDIASLGLSFADLVTAGKIPAIGKANEFVRENLNARNVTKGLTGEKFEPKNEGERRADEVVSDLATYLVPLGGKVKVVPALIKTALGNAAGFLGEKVGGALGNSSVGKGIAKIGSVLLYSFAGGRKALNKVMAQSYKNTDSLAGTAKEGARQLGNDITTLTKDVTTGIKTPGKTFVADSIKGVSEYIKNGKIAIKDAIKSEKEINELLRDPQTPATAKKYLGRLSESFSKILNSYGKSNPEFGKAYSESKDIYRGLHKASDIAQAIQKSVKQESLTSNLIKSILTFAALKNPAALAVGGAALGAGLGIQKLTKFTQLLKNSSEAKKFYKNIMLAALKDNASLIRRNAQKLDKIATEEGY